MWTTRISHSKRPLWQVGIILLVLMLPISQTGLTGAAPLAHDDGHESEEVTFSESELVQPVIHEDEYPFKAQQVQRPFAPKQLIFISDGMRPDLVEKYAQSGDMPNYAKIISEGVTGENGMVPAVAANTGANWTTISTASWTGMHGQVNNTFHIVSNPITSTSTSGFDGSRNLAETYQEVLE